jgi:DNA repair protein SbcD/Mre11
LASEAHVKATFLHLADVHLGNEQYGLPERARDFALAFHAAVEYAIYYEVDFVVIAGDLFERSTLDPVTFDQAMQELELLRNAGIPVINIAGNHDRARYGQGMAWVESLGRHGFLYYLDAAKQGEVRLVPWSEEAGWGGYLDMKGMRFVGLRYLGASTPWAVEELAKQLQELSSGDRPYTVAMLHGGLDGEVPYIRAEMTYPQLSILRGLVDYLALGHIHKHYSREGWLYNPGSMETWSVQEISRRWPRGFLHVAVDTESESKHVVRLVEPPRRAFLHHEIDVQACTSPEDVTRLVLQALSQAPKKAGVGSPLVYVALTGRLRFDRRDLDLKALEGQVATATEALAVQIQDRTDDTDFGFTAGPSGEGDRLDLGQLELDVFRHFFSNDERRVHSASEWARLAQEMKRETLSRRSPEELAELVRQRAPLLATRPDGGSGS